jgi:hypothetical protein
MAIIQCTECKGRISDKARSCPHCGCPAHAFNSADLDQHRDQETLASRQTRTPTERVERQIFSDYSKNIVTALVMLAIIAAYFLSTPYSKSVLAVQSKCDLTQAQQQSLESIPLSHRAPIKEMSCSEIGELADRLGKLSLAERAKQFGDETAGSTATTDCNLGAVSDCSCYCEYSGIEIEVREQLSSLNDEKMQCLPCGLQRRVIRAVALIPADQRNVIIAGFIDDLAHRR